MAIIKRHGFLLIGLAAIGYFFSVDITALKPGVLEYAVFTVGFVAIAVYVAQSFVRFRQSAQHHDERAQP
jgi:bacteriorhodopsin